MSVCLPVCLSVRLSICLCLRTSDGQMLKCAFACVWSSCSFLSDFYRNLVSVGAHILQNLKYGKFKKTLVVAVTVTVLQTPIRTSRRQKPLLAAAWRRNLTINSQCILEFNYFLSSSVNGRYGRSSVRAVTRQDCLPPDTLLQGSTNVPRQMSAPVRRSQTYLVSLQMAVRLVWQRQHLRVHTDRSLRKEKQQRVIK